MRTNDVNLPVYFDDLKVTHTHSPVIQKGAAREEIFWEKILARSQVAGRDYLFGLSFNSYTRPAITAQNFKFNAGSELESMTDWYSTPFRKYDPSLGRFHGVDALADLYTSMTPSHFAGNNPIMANDPTGLYQDDGDGEPVGSGTIILPGITIRDTPLNNNVSIYSSVLSSYSGNSQSVFFGHPEGNNYTNNPSIPSGGGGSRPVLPNFNLSAKNVTIPMQGPPIINVTPINHESIDVEAALANFFGGAVLTPVWNYGFSAVLKTAGVELLSLTFRYSPLALLTLTGDTEKVVPYPLGWANTDNVELGEDIQKITLYRGVRFNPQHPAQYEEALMGIATPIGLLNGHSSPSRHAAYDTNSIFTSWSSAEFVARQFAGPGGVMLKKEFLPWEILPGSPNLLNEHELLVPGVVYGAVPIIISGQR